jgi:hypothetical protein
MFPEFSLPITTRLFSLFASLSCFEYGRLYRSLLAILGSFKCHFTGIGGYFASIGGHSTGVGVYLIITGGRSSREHMCAHCVWLIFGK